MELDGEFVANTTIRGRIAATQVDPEIAALQRPYLGIAFELYIERIEPMRLFSFHWHPGAVEPGVDYSNEPTTRVSFELDALSGGTLLTLTESGFDKIPTERRSKALHANETGWVMQMRLIAKYLGKPATRGTAVASAAPM
jgi:hypothetical protein